MVSHPQSDAATVLCATSQGTVLRLRVPGDVTAAVASSTTPELWLDAAATGGCGITSLDSDMQEVVFATRTGALGIANLDRGCAAPTFLLPGGSCTSFAAVRFVSTGGGGHRAAAGGGGSHVVATVGSTPGCCLFDPFAPSTSRPALRCAGSSPVQRFRCLAVEPGTSHGALLAAGSADEAAACVWDTRQPATPLWSWSQHAGGDSAGAYCTAVAFDPGACFSSSPGEDYGHMQSLGGTTSTQRTSGLLLATSAGVLLGCTVSKGQVPLVALARESVPVAHCAIVPTSGQQLAAVTDSECLLLWDARSAGALDPMM